MEEALRQRVTVQEGGRIELSSPRLRPGDEAEVIVIVERPSVAQNGHGGGVRSNASFLGAGRGVFPSPADADEFLRRERHRWQG